MSSSVQNAGGIVAVGIVVGAAVLGYTGWLTSSSAAAIQNGDFTVGSSGLLVKAPVINLDDKAARDNWVSAVEKTIEEDRRLQPWKAEVGDLVADREFISYRRSHEMDETDIMKNAVPKKCGCQTTWNPYPTYQASSSEGTPPSTAPRPYPTTFTG
ncbi:hypothetical protein B7463_g5471, partial [Scytalidium lignicola]